MGLQSDDLTFDADSAGVAGASEVGLSPKAFDLLALLIERRPRTAGEIVRRRRPLPRTGSGRNGAASRLIGSVGPRLGDHLLGDLTAERSASTA